MQAYLESTANFDSIYTDSYRRFVGVDLLLADHASTRDLFGTVPLHLSGDLDANMFATQLREAMRKEFGTHDRSQEPRVAGWLTRIFMARGRAFRGWTRCGAPPGVRSTPGRRRSSSRWTCGRAVRRRAYGDGRMVHAHGDGARARAVRRRVYVRTATVHGVCAWASATNASGVQRQRRVVCIRRQRRRTARTALPNQTQHQRRERGDQCSRAEIHGGARRRRRRAEPLQHLGMRLR